MRKAFQTQPELFVSSAELDHPALHELDDTEAVLDWDRLEALMSDIYASPTGCPSYGAEGFWGRWEKYMADGHGGNIELRKLGSRNYRLSVLKVSSSDATIEDIIRAENNWKERLCSRSLGLNAN